VTRTADELRFATRRWMERHRVIRWQPMAAPAQQPAFVPEWLKRGMAVKDFTGTTAL
jgi:hypothetical protein